MGPLQTLTVTAASDGEHYEVVAGKRRLAALKLLAKRHKLDKVHEVPCLQVPDASARTVSLTENVPETETQEGIRRRCGFLHRHVQLPVKTRVHAEGNSLGH